MTRTYKLGRAKELNKTQPSPFWISLRSVDLISMWMPNQQLWPKLNLHVFCPVFASWWPRPSIWEVGCQYGQLLNQHPAGQVWSGLPLGRPSFLLPKAVFISSPQPPSGVRLSRAAERGWTLLILEVAISMDSFLLSECTEVLNADSNEWITYSLM